MPPLSRRIKRFREAVTRRTDQRGSDDEAEMDEGMDTEEEESKLQELARRGRQDIRRARRRVSTPFIPVSEEVQSAQREGRRLGQALRATPEARKARAAAEKLEEKREEAAELSEKAGMGNIEQAAQAFEEEGDRSLEEFGGFDNDFDDIGSGVEQELTFEAIETAEEDGDFTDDVVDPVERVEGEVDMALEDL